MIRDTRTAYRARAAATERSIDAALAEVKVAREAAEAEARAAYARRNAPVPFTPEQLAAARVVRTVYGWERLVRVNAKTVTVAGDFGDYRTPITAILEVRA